jgi:serine/threonine-protein kinase
METRSPSEGARPGFAAPATCASCGAPFTPALAGQSLCDKCQGLAHPEPPPSPLQHAEVAGYKLVQELGAGRFAVSWLAHDAEGRAVVLKLLRRYAPDPNTVQRFLAEAQRACAAPELDHPHLARPLNAGVHLVSAFFLVYASGGEMTLADELRQRGRVLPARALELCAQIAEGLASAHRAGVLHLDLKPANVGVTRLADGTEQVLVLDAATTHLLGKAGLRDGATLPLSSAAYMSPEEAAGKPLDPRSDLYSLGVLLYQLLSGRLPFMGGNADELLTAHREHAPLRLRDAGKRVHADLEALLAQVLSKDKAQRPSSGDELAVILRALAPIADTAPMDDGDDSIEDPVPVVALPPPEPEVAPAPLPEPLDPALERALMGEVPAQRPEPIPGLPKWAPRLWPSWWPLAAAAALVVIIGTVLLARGGKKKTPPARPAPVTTSPAPAPVSPPAPNPALAPAPNPAPEKPGKPAQAPNPNAKLFERAQKAIWTGQPALAESSLQDLLSRKKLPKPDRARATKMMGDMFAKKGDKQHATDWYRKSLQLYDDPSERAKVVKLLQSLR